MEIWRDIPGYEGLYQVSAFGKVKSLITNRILKDRFDHKGYLSVILYKNNTKKVIKVHRLVAKIFLDNKDNKEQVNHKDGNKANNNVSNLEWCNCKENIQHAFKIKLKENPKYGNHPEAKKVCQYDMDGNLIKIYNSISQARDENNFNSSKICACCKGKQQSSFGYKWSYLGGVI